MKKNLEIAILASVEAGEAIIQVYNSDDFNVEIKDDNSPLTIADKKANDIINRYLDQTDIPIISEENKQLPFSIRKDWSSCWIVDPLDGTKEFIKRNGEFTVNIALVKEGKPILGVIYVPVSKTLYYTSGDSKSYKITLENTNCTLDYIIRNASEISPIKNIEPPVLIVGSRSHLNDDTKNFISEIEKNNDVAIVSKGSSLKFCLVAEGSAHLYPRFAPTMEWDTAAGHAICRNVGVKVIDQTTAKEMKYNKSNLLNNYFVVKL